MVSSLNSLLVVIPDWLSAVREGTKKSENIQAKIQQCRGGLLTVDWKVIDNLLHYKGKLFLDKASELVPLITRELHSSVHEGLEKPCTELSRYFEGKGCFNLLNNLFKAVKYVKEIKGIAYHQKGYSTSADMDFIEGLPKSEGKTMVFDRLSKYTHFAPATHSYTTQQIDRLFFNYIFKLYGLPKSIVSDKDPVFLTKICKEPFRLQGVSFNMSSAYHPRIDG